MFCNLMYTNFETNDETNEFTYFIIREWFCKDEMC